MFCFNSSCYFLSLGVSSPAPAGAAPPVHHLLHDTESSSGLAPGPDQLPASSPSLQPPDQLPASSAREQLRLQLPRARRIWRPGRRSGRIRRPPASTGQWSSWAVLSPVLPFPCQYLSAAGCKFSASDSIHYCQAFKLSSCQFSASDSIHRAGAAQPRPKSDKPIPELLGGSGPGEGGQERVLGQG